MPEDLVNKNVDHIYLMSKKMERLHRLHIVDLSQVLQKNNDPMQTTFKIVYDSIYNDGESENEQEPDEEDTSEYALLQDYHEGNLIMLN